MSESHDLPLVASLEPHLPPEVAFLRLAHLPHVLFLDSALVDGKNGRYSFLCADPVAWMQALSPEELPLTQLKRELGRYAGDHVPGLPPFQGGVAGLFSYEMARSLEVIPAARFNEFQLPIFAAGTYDVVLAYDLVAHQAWVISQGIPELDPQLRRQRAARRLKWFEDLLRTPERKGDPFPRQQQASPPGGVQLAPQFETGRMRGVTSNFSRQGYLAAVQKCIDYICAGDVFQVNLSQRLLCSQASDSITLYRRLRERNGAPMAAYFDLGSSQILSASPERLVRLREGQVESRPIKGTRTRTIRPEADLFAGDELKQSEKDRAENIMIVDLMRNDLSCVCQPDSVEVMQLCELETFAYVQHLVSTVAGRLREPNTSLDLLQATFPGGSVTGAPKIRAMEIIAELEPTVRGPYCGSLFYIGLDGSMDMSILIRTLTATGGWWQLPVGGGIVAQSNPELEYEETWHKAEGMLRAL